MFSQGRPFSLYISLIAHKMVLRKLFPPRNNLRIKRTYMWPPFFVRRPLDRLARCARKLERKKLKPARESEKEERTSCFRLLVFAHPRFFFSRFQFRVTLKLVELNPNCNRLFLYHLWLQSRFQSPVLVASDVKIQGYLQLTPFPGRLSSFRILE